MQIFGYKRVWATAAAAAILALFCFRVYSFQPREFFDFYHDDAIYFTTAKALAAGCGYIIPSFPGVLPQTKYPVLYPLILAVVWRIWPAYPANLGPAVAMSIAIAGIYLVLGYLFLRRAGASTCVSLGIVAVIALHPGLSFLAGNLLSDYLFAVLILASAMAADEMCNVSQDDRCWGPITGLLLGLTMLVRFAAIGAVAGILLYGVQHRRWRAVVTLAATCAVVVLAVALTTRLTFPPYVAAGVGVPPIGFQPAKKLNHHGTCAPRFDHFSWGCYALARFKPPPRNSVHIYRQSTGAPHLELSYLRSLFAPIYTFDLAWCGSRTAKDYFLAQFCCSDRRPYQSYRCDTGCYHSAYCHHAQWVQLLALRS